MMPLFRRAAITRTRKKNAMQKLCRLDWISLAVAGLLCLALAAVYLICGANQAFLNFSVPGCAVLALAEPVSLASAEATAPPQTPVRVRLEEKAVPAVAIEDDKQRREPQILIYHTHATEAYFPTESDSYEPSGQWRTLETQKSVVAVGARLAQLLENEYGFSVIHDTANYEPPKLSSAYSRSLLAMERYKEQYATLTVFIDIHRDAFSSGGKSAGKPTDYIELDGKQVARLMCVVGTGEGATGAGFDKRPDFQSNLALAQRVTNRLRARDERLARDIRIKTGRYNQHVSDACLLVEVGHNANTLSQAFHAVPYLAEAIASALDDAAAPRELATMAVWSP